MKKAMYLIVLLPAFLLRSCSCEGEDTATINDNEIVDPVVGTWRLTSAIKFENGKATEIELTECEKLSTMAFKADRTLIDQAFEAVEGEGCISDSTAFLIWENRGNGVYVFMNENDDSFTVNLAFENDMVTFTSFDNEDNPLSKETYTAITFVANDPDPILGTWKLTEVTIVEDGEEETFPAIDCKVHPTLEVKANGTLTNPAFAEGEENDCISNGIAPGTWKNQGNGKYIFTDEVGKALIMNGIFGDNTLTLEAFDEEGNRIFTEVYSKQ